MLGVCCSVVPTQGCQKCDRWCTGTLDGLVGSHTRLAFYLAFAICCRRVVIHALLNIRFKGMQVVTYPANIKQLKSHWLKSSPERSGYMQMDKQITQSILVMLCSTRGTKTAKVEGLWLVNRPKCSVLEDPENSSEVQLCSPFIVPSFNSMRYPCDVISWCHDCLLWSSSGKTTALVHQKTLSFICASASIHARISEYYKCIWNLSIFSLTQFPCLWHIFATYMADNLVHDILGHAIEHWHVIGKIEIKYKLQVILYKSYEQ